jgi:Mlc titration factor MtfA (ptsG expression regulator)
MRYSYHKCFGEAQFAVFGHRSDQQGMKVTEPFRVGTATQKRLNLLLQAKLLSYQHCVSVLLFPRPFFAGPAWIDHLNTALSCTMPP